MKYVNLQDIRAHRPCASGWRKLLKYLNAQPSDHRRVALSTILKSNGIQDAIWCLQVRPVIDGRLFAADVAESVLHIYEKAYPDDDRIRDTIKVVKDRNATPRALRNATNAAYAAAYATYDAAAYAAYAAAYAAYAATYDAAAYAAYDAAAYATAYAAAYDADAAYADAEKWQEIEQIFLKHFG